MDMYFWGHSFMWIVPLVFLVGAVLLLALLFRGPWLGWPGVGQGRRPETAREILDQRYARGEITKEQYEEMKRALER
jgi:putative membrane protein